MCNSTRNKNYYSKEIKEGSFERLVQLPALVVAEQTRTEYKDGVLKILMPKKTSSSQKKVKIKISKK